jgi:hypothetical protein
MAAVSKGMADYDEIKAAVLDYFYNKHSWVVPYDVLLEHLRGLKMATLEVYLPKADVTMEREYTSLLKNTLYNVLVDLHNAGKIDRMTKGWKLSSSQWLRMTRLRQLLLSTSTSSLTTGTTGTT